MSLSGHNESNIHHLKDSFAVIAVRCNSNSSTGKRKLVPQQIYYLLDGYNLEKQSVVGYPDQHLFSSIHDDYLLTDDRMHPHILISAIVGQNGSGKSSIVEFIMRLINNLAAAAFGELKDNVTSERLHYIEGIDGDLWYVVNGVVYQLHVKDSLVELYNVDKSFEIDSQSPVFSSSNDCNEGSTIYIRTSDDKLKEHFDNFFYTIINNYSIFAYNTKDFFEENDSQEKIDKVNKKFPPIDRDFLKCGNWLDGLFHKNDGYQIPIVITPKREDGNIDINTENKLAKERLISLLVRSKEFRKVNGHLVADGITIKFRSNTDYGLSFVRQRLNWSNLIKGDYQKIKKIITNGWLSLINIGSIEVSPEKSPFYDIAINYLTYKTLKIALTYRQHRLGIPINKKKLKNNKGYRGNLLDCVMHSLESQKKDFSHITRKIYQTLAYIAFGIYTHSFETITDEHISSDVYFSLGEIQEKYEASEILKLKNTKIDTPENALYQQAAVPPPFFSNVINFHEDDTQKTPIVFESLSSGEKQLAFSISSILYHIDNLDSINSDKSDELRIRYKNIFIVLEEIELYFHPELQQSLIKNVLDGIKQLNLESIKNIHFLIVTHSPYVLSDIIRQNVLALENNGLPSDRQLNTFCANIHEMLEDSFFLSNGAQGFFSQWEVGLLMTCIKIYQIFHLDKNKILSIAELDKQYDGSKDQLYECLIKKYSNNEQRKTPFFDYSRFSKDFSIQKLKGRIAVVDEPVIRSIIEHELNIVIDTDRQLRHIRMKELEEELKRLKDKDIE